MMDIAIVVERYRQKFVIISKHSTNAFYHSEQMWLYFDVHHDRESRRHRENRYHDRVTQ